MSVIDILDPFLLLLGCLYPLLLYPPICVLLFWTILYILELLVLSFELSYLWMSFLFRGDISFLTSNENELFGFWLLITIWDISTLGCDILLLLIKWSYFGVLLLLPFILGNCLCTATYLFSIKGWPDHFLIGDGLLNILFFLLKVLAWCL